MHIPQRRTSIYLMMCFVGALLAAFTPHAAIAANGSVAYTYDALGRVTTVSYDTGVCIIYTYDPNGNRLSETINVTSSGGPAVWGCFNWAAANWTPH